MCSDDNRSWFLVALREMLWRLKTWTVTSELISSIVCLRFSRSAYSCYLFENIGFYTSQSIRIRPNENCLVVKKYLFGQRVKTNLNRRVRKPTNLIRIKTKDYFNLTIKLFKKLIVEQRWSSPVWTKNNLLNRKLTEWRLYNKNLI